MRTATSLALTLAVLLAIAAGCGPAPGSGGSGPTPTPGTATFRASILPIVQAHNCAGCHNPSGGPPCGLDWSLTDPNAVYSSLMAASCGPAVVTSSADSSWLLLAPLQDSSFTLHPLKPWADTSNAEYLTARSWILAGAQNN